MDERLTAELTLREDIGLSAPAMVRVRGRMSEGDHWIRKGRHVFWTDNGVATVLAELGIDAGEQEVSEPEIIRLEVDRANFPNRRLVMATDGRAVWVKDNRKPKRGVIIHAKMRRGMLTMVGRP